MQLTPNQTFENIKAALVEYIETAYKIAHPDIYAERATALRASNVIARSPFVESTPSFPTARKLVELERQYPHIIPNGLAELIQHGVPVDRFPLYQHQEDALLAAFSEQSNLLVATGTGSGKTETFLLPILSDILREAWTWPTTSRNPERGHYNAEHNVWLHGRRHELRPAAIRGIILYPMNALVNDQLTRLRRIFARGNSPDWQRRNLKGNVIHFGMYTGLTQPKGNYTDKWRRDKFEEYFKGIEADWTTLREDLRDTGGWARPDSPEMLCRWDIQQAPPDILVTNYSMLEYMLVRPIEYNIFAKTREWLVTNPDARITLVLDEAHTYTGAKGTEVAHLVRRLKERLGLNSGSSQFRAIATSASIPNVAGADDQLRRFISDLFGEPTDSFSLIRVPNTETTLGARVPNQRNLAAFAAFHDKFDLQNPWPSVEQLANDLDLGYVDRTMDPQVVLYKLLEANDDIGWVRRRTARQATLLDTLAVECWGPLSTAAERDKATAGVLSAGSLARAASLADTPPLLSMRIHMFFRGISGNWACMNPDCPEVAERFKLSGRNRPIGKLYTEPRVWCSPACGARVLELFSCRHCGLLFLGGIPDHTTSSLWPWSDDLSGERQDIHEFQIFGVECPHSDAVESYRSMRTTLEAHRGEVFVRTVYEVEPAEENGQVISPFPQICPRCQNYRGRGIDGREVIEPLRTKGPQAFSVIVEESFRHQPRVAKGEPPNYGRKALLFSDSRQEAAILAANLRKFHDQDLFRQLAMRALYSCSQCFGSGQVEEDLPFVIGKQHEKLVRPCPLCDGTGQVIEALPLDFQSLRSRVIDIQLNRGIDPTGGEVGLFFSYLATGDQRVYQDAQLAFALSLRRDLAEDEYALEPLGLASWHVQLPSDMGGSFDKLDEYESRLLLRATARIIAHEKALLPPHPMDPWAWPQDLVKEYERPVLIWANAKKGRTIIPYNLGKYRKLGRYVHAVAQQLQQSGRLGSSLPSERWVDNLRKPLWDALKGLRIIQSAGNKIDNEIPYGIRIDSFVLQPIGDTVERCRACSYIMSETLLSVCVRCGHTTECVKTSEINSYYRRAAFQALPASKYDDPYPLRASEHTAQIASPEARNEERWFQDLFHDDQNHYDHRVDILSVTTTMEMGIDIGSLLAVGLRNVPPTVANYQQRAGRAGRRGSALATVLTFAQMRSHDQYYFSRPPEIVSDPPRVPSLYLNNEVIARRHIRSLVLQDFFYTNFRQSKQTGLFSSWGTIANFITLNMADRLQIYLSSNRSPLLIRCISVVHSSLAPRVTTWLDELRNELLDVVSKHEASDDLFEVLISSGLLPKYAFPVDLVSLSIPQDLESSSRASEYGDNDVMQRDLKIALVEYAPGAEVVRGSFPNTYKYRSTAVYDPFEKEPNYRPTGKLVECEDCQSISLISVSADVPTQCGECNSFNMIALDYLRPRGFTVDSALPKGGRVRYEGDGRERSGYASPARLQIGQSAFSIGASRTPFAPNLYTHVRRGNLFICNKGPDRDFPGYLVCPQCGRVLDPDDTGSHTYPANVPPHQGRNRGPRAGNLCPNRTNFQNQVILGYPFTSEIILCGVDLSMMLDAPYTQVSGKAVWHSFATLLANAATRVLQVDPGELKTGIRAARRGVDRVHAEVFLYDDVPGGAGYASAVDQNLNEILCKALELGRTCDNVSCGGACYHCLLDYRNQYNHPLLDRALGTAVLEYLLEGKTPQVTSHEAQAAGTTLAEYAQSHYRVLPSSTYDGQDFPLILETTNKQEKIGLWVIHPLQARPSIDDQHSIHARHGLRCAVHTTFDLQRRPFWVMNNLVNA